MKAVEKRKTSKNKTFICYLIVTPIEMTRYVVVSYYQEGDGYHSSNLKDGIEGGVSSGGIKNLDELVQSLKEERDFFPAGTPIGFINMVPKSRENDNTQRLSPKDERIVMTKLYKS